MKNFLVTTTPLLDGIKITEYLGVVNANIVIGANFFSDFAASLTDFFGGRSGSYQNRMNEMYDAAIKELRRKTMQLGGNTIVNFNVDFDELAGKGKSMFMLSATGTACKADIKENSKVDGDNTLSVSSEQLKRALDKQKIIDKLSKKTALYEDDWNMMYNNPTADYLDYIFQSYYLDYKDHTVQLVSLLNEEDVVPRVYKYYPQNKALAWLINKCNLFDPKSVLDMFAIDINLGLDVLNAGKDSYNYEDLKIMEQIVNFLDNLPDKSTHTTGKLSVFGKETNIIICPNGHKYSAEEDSCPTCGCDIHGLSIDDRVAVQKFKDTVSVLNKELSLLS